MKMEVDGGSKLFQVKIVILPVKIGIPSTRIDYYSYKNNDAEKRVNLDLLPKKEETHFYV